MKTTQWIIKNTADLSGKTVAISGATGGLGREICFHLCSLGAALCLLDRNEQKSKALENNLKEQYPDAIISRILLDLEDIESVKAAADRLCSAPPDYLILNAGAYSIPRHKCSTGFDNVYQINFVSPYYLARTLLPHIKSKGGKIVAVGSIAHNYSHFDPQDPDFSSRTKASLCYGNAKRQLMFSLWGLDENNTVCIAHPGITFTNITAHYPPLIFALIKHPMKLIFMKPVRASLSILSGLFCYCDRNEWIGPRVFDIWGLPRRRVLDTASKDEARKITALADKIYENLK